MDKKRILLVEDEKDLVDIVKFRLEANNYEVVVAYDGQEALDRAKKEKPDLIILDLMLPKIDGFKVCRMLKFDEKYKKIPIIMFTARAQESDKKLGEEVGADAYITKPFDLEEVLVLVQRAMESRRLSRAFQELKQEVKKRFEPGVNMIGVQSFESNSSKILVMFVR